MKLHIRYTKILIPNQELLNLLRAVPSTASIYVVHRGIGSFQMKPPTGSVGADQLAANLKTFTTDVHTGDGSTTAFTLSETPANASSIMVFVDGILQKATTNYSLSGTTLTFTTAPDASAEIETKHLTIRGLLVEVQTSNMIHLLVMVQQQHLL